MTWLEPSQDAVEETLRRALDAARARTGDEIARRRVWTRIAEPALPGRRHPWLTRVMVVGTLAAGAAGAALVWPHSIARDRPVPPVSVLPPAPGPVAVPPTTTVTPSQPRMAILDGPKVVRTRARQRARLRLPGNAEADLEPNSVLKVDRSQRASIDRGRVSLAVPKQPPGQHFTIGAGPYTISVLGTKFHVRVAGKSVGVEVDEGVVEVWRNGHKVRVEPGESFTSAPDREVQRPARRVAVREAPRTLLRPTPPLAMPSTGPFREVQAALAEGHPQRALEILEVAARGDGPEAENAAYEVGWVLRDRMVRPRQAVAAWNRYRARFPRGLLRAETDVSVLETLLMMGDTHTALGEARAFLERHPGSERREEIAQVIRGLQAESAVPSESGDPSSR
jgi:hypothetical protein